MDMSRMIFVTGFARGGTTWLRNCIGTHPQISRIGSELVLFRDHAGDRGPMEAIIEQKIRDQKLSGPYFVEKSPANAPHIDDAVKLLPEAKFVFIIRDPRDVFISHKRGTRQWMGGVNKRVDGCMKKIHGYYEGYVRARQARNLLLVRYEELHQDFHRTMKRLFDFIGVESTPQILDECYEQNSFWTVASRHIERPDEAERKGVVGDWAMFLEPKEAEWFQKNGYWSGFMKQYGYSWTPPTYAGIFQAMAHAGAHALSEDDLLAQRLDRRLLNVMLCHDVDSLRMTYSQESILAAAQAQAKLGFASMFFFLPLDDPRYAGVKPARIVEFIKEVRAGNRQASIGLHLNAAERFFPADMEDVGDEHPDMTKAIEYLHEQIDAYEKFGIRFRVATAHGYGRRKKKPNNRDSRVFTDELQKRGIALWDTVLRPQIFEIATHVAHFADVGGTISARQMPTSGELTDPNSYRAFPVGSLIHFLIHPGNYDVRQPTTLGRRQNRALPIAPAAQPSRSI